MIVGLIGPHACGKETIAMYLRDKYNFLIIDIWWIFCHYYSQLKDQEGSMAENIKALKIDKIYHEEFEHEEAILNQQYNAEFNHERNILLRDKVNDALVEIFKEDWRKFFVVYPLLWPAEMSVKIRRLYFILYEIQAPTLMRFNWF